VRYERQTPGELVHIDIKKLGKIDGVGHRIHGDRRTRKRGIGWDAVHLAIDDYSRVSFGMVLPDETAASCIQFLKAAIEHYRELGVRVAAVMTDNGSGYKNTFRSACAELGIRHLRTKPYTPRTNGKVERFVQTSLCEWAYARAYDSSESRARALDRFLCYYNYFRPHTALGRMPPISRITTVNNLLKLDS
jgi:transposase InsO family protein